jgi:hypothetical protein
LNKREIMCASGESRVDNVCVERSIQ